MSNLFRSSLANLCHRNFSQMRYMSSHLAAFEQAQKRLESVTASPSNATKLKLYGLFKQATKGPCNVSKPGMLDIVGKAKWEAWNGLGKMSQDEAQRLYSLEVDALAGAGGATASPQAPQSSDPQDAPVIREKIGHIYKIRLNRPSKKNALLNQMYNDIREGLEEAAKDPNIRVTVLTGTGDYYCSGNDLSNFTPQDLGDIPTIAKAAKNLLQKYVGAFIDHPKPLVALINGPAVGIAVTVLGLCDFVYASDTANFVTPFPQVGQTPEGCSSYIFPRLMGTTKAFEMLAGKKLSVQDAVSCGLVTEIIPHDQLAAEGMKRAEYLANLAPNVVGHIKNLLRKNMKEDLHRVNKEECELLEKVWQSEECMAAIMSFFSKKSKM